GEHDHSRPDAEHHRNVRPLRRVSVHAIGTPVDGHGVRKHRQPRADDRRGHEEKTKWRDQTDPDECGAGAADVIIHRVVSFTREARVGGAMPSDAARATRARMAWARAIRGPAEAETTAPRPRRRSIRPSSRSSW